jgi:hypothetical protein
MSCFAFHKSLASPTTEGYMHRGFNHRAGVDAGFALLLAFDGRLSLKGQTVDSQPANFYEPQTALQIISGLEQFLQQQGIQDVKELVGSVRAGK